MKLKDSTLRRWSEIKKIGNPLSLCFPKKRETSAYFKGFFDILPRLGSPRTYWEMLKPVFIIGQIPSLNQTCITLDNLILIDFIFIAISHTKLGRSDASLEDYSEYLYTHASQFIKLI